MEESKSNDQVAVRFSWLASNYGLRRMEEPGVEIIDIPYVVELVIP